MTMLTNVKVIGIFGISDDFCKEYEKEIQNHQIQAGIVTKKPSIKFEAL